MKLPGRICRREKEMACGCQLKCDAYSCQQMNGNA